MRLHYDTIERNEFDIANRRSTMSQSTSPTVAVIGTGYWGQNLVRNFHELGALKTVFDADIQARTKMAATYPDLQTAGKIDDILDDPEIIGVALATPAATHFDLARQALEAGKHVLVEKPLALTAAEGKSLVELAAQRGRVLMVDHILQNHPAYKKLRQLAADGVLGSLKHIYSRRLSFGKIRREEDVLWSFAPHDISMILGLAGSWPNKVSAFGQPCLTKGVADNAQAHLWFPGGLEARIEVSWLNPFKEHRLVVVGDKKMAVFDDTRPWPEKLTLYAHQVNWTAGRPTAESAPAEPVALKEGEPLKNQCRDFLRAMSGQAEPVSDGREGLRVLSVLETLSESIRRKGETVSLNQAESDYFAHPTAVIDDGVSIGRGSKIWHFSHILPGSELGENVNVGQNVVIGPRVKIGRGVKIQNNVSVYEGVTLEDDVFCGPSMVFTNVINPRANVARKDEYLPTLLKRGATVGANATVVCGHTLGAWCLIGAGAVVTRDVPDYALMIGNPARHHGWVCRCGVKLPAALTCPACGRAYRETGGSLAPATDKDGEE